MFFPRGGDGVFFPGQVVDHGALPAPRGAPPAPSEALLEASRGVFFPREVTVCFSLGM